jgi:hypothetical protein
LVADLETYMASLKSPQDPHLSTSQQMFYVAWATGWSREEIFAMSIFEFQEAFVMAWSAYTMQRVDLLFGGGDRQQARGGRHEVYRFKGRGIPNTSARVIRK